MTTNSHWRGHPIIWKDEKWLFADNEDPTPGYGGKTRPCAKCGLLFEGSHIGDADPCLGELPGVNNACCGHGVPGMAYVRFINGMVLKGFSVESRRHSTNGGSNEQTER